MHTRFALPFLLTSGGRIWTTDICPLPTMDDIHFDTTQPEPPPMQPAARVHPLDRREDRRTDEWRVDDLRTMAAETARIRIAWAKLVWLLAFLALLLAISYLVPHIAEQTQYAITRGKQRAEHDFAREHVGESPIGELSRAYQMGVPGRRA